MWLPLTNRSAPNLAKRRDEKVREILQEIQKIVGGIAKRDGYTLVLNDRVMIYGEPELNVTEEVMKTLNDSYTEVVIHPL
jgi:Skp family chaperone for outer membrane proteins